MSEPNSMNECYSCKFKASVPGNAHIRCTKPSEAVIAEADPYGMANGWFDYPSCFDPTWKGEKRCENYQSTE
jgi:hypothetical protein